MTETNTPDLKKKMIGACIRHIQQDMAVERLGSQNGYSARLSS
jgi:hypothetical protein